MRLHEASRLPALVPRSRNIILSNDAEVKVTSVLFIYIIRIILSLRELIDGVAMSKLCAVSCQFIRQLQAICFLSVNVPSIGELNYRHNLPVCL